LPCNWGPNGIQVCPAVLTCIKTSYHAYILSCIHNLSYRNLRLILLTYFTYLDGFTHLLSLSSSSEIFPSFHNLLAPESMGNSSNLAWRSEINYSDSPDNPLTSFVNRILLNFLLRPLVLALNTISTCPCFPYDIDITLTLSIPLKSLSP
jgi:hypothetical protein